jgi:hypothetical protein
MSSVREKINAGAYKTTLPYPSRVVEPAVLRKSARDLTADEMASLSATKQKFEQDKEAERTAKVAYNTDTERLKAQFKADLFAEHGVTLGDALGEVVWRKAWEDGHSAGYGEIATHFEYLTDIIDTVNMYYVRKA